MMMLRRVVWSPLMASRGGSCSQSLLLLRSFSAVTTLSPSSSKTVSCGGIADVAAADDLAESAATVEMEPALLQRRVVVYDGVCRLCHGGVKWVIQADKDRKIKFCCLQSKAAEPYMRASGLEREDVLRRFLFVEGPGQYHQGSTAALRVLSHLPLPYSALSTLLMMVPALLRDAVYDYVAKRRYNWFGKGDDCLVLQDKESLHRHIDRDEILDRERSGM